MHVALNASSCVGALRGLHTLAATPHTILASLAGNGTRSREWELRSPWRGVLIDTARHYLPVPTILELMDAMELAHLNVLSWHITDAQSWPLVIASHPELAAKAAFGPDFVYTRAQVDTIVAYAHQRAIRVVPGIDMPGHMAAVGKAYPEMIVKPLVYDKIDEFALNVSSPAALALVKDILTEVADMFPDPYIRVGGDEVSRAVMEPDAFADFESFVLGVVRELGKQALVWQDAMDDGALAHVPPVSPPWAPAVESWKCWQGLGLRGAERALSAGARVLVAHCWYLDYFDTPAEEFMFRDMVGEVLDAADAVGVARSTVLGGEFALWSEHMDASTVMCHAWPRGLAVAHLLAWGPLAPHQNATAVLEAAAAALVAGGVPAAAWLTRRAAAVDGFQCGSIGMDVHWGARGSPGPSFAQLNVDAGGDGSPLGVQGLLDWVRVLEPDVIGMCELNGWDRSDLLPQRAAAMGFGFWAFLPIPSGYHLGLFSRTPIRVIAKACAPHAPLERGMLHVVVRGVHVLVIHLQAHEAWRRAREAAWIVDHVYATVPRDAPIMIMGDFNTLSPTDDTACGYSADLVDRINRAGWTTLADKYLLAPDFHSVDFGPFNAFADAGFVDGVSGASVDPVCEYTEPTELGIDQIAGPTPASLRMRVDYVLTRSLPSPLSCHVARDNTTVVLSDHFPTLCFPAA